VHPLTFLLIAILFSAVPAPSAGGQGGNPAPPPAVRPDPLAEARELYNAKQFDRAAEKAEEARKLPDLANAAALVYARARLEQFRVTADAAALASAREAIRTVEMAPLSPRDQVELLVGLGEALYFDDPPRFSAAAEFFELALARDAGVPERERATIFEWWAGALDRQATFGPQSERKAVYTRLLRGAEAERARDDRSGVAWYWLALAARGTDDLERAWGHAISGWIHAAQLGDQGTQLRADLDKLVTDVILPERARLLTTAGDPRDALVLLRQQWEELKKKWARDTDAGARSGN
jgi:hypothetical protein